MPVIECDPNAARERLTDAGVTIGSGSTEHELWRAETDTATAIAYDGKVLVQGNRPEEILSVLRDAGGRAHVYFDGASRGNPGPSAIGWVVLTGDGIVTEGGTRIEETTNNRAEYEALIHALSVTAEYGFDTVDIRGDSQLVIKQVTGAWNVNEPALRELRIRARELLERFDEYSLTHVPRDINERADELANAALDGND